MGVHYPTQDLHSIATLASRAAATYTYSMPPVREHRGVTFMFSVTVSGASGTLDAVVNYQNPSSLVWTAIPSVALVQFGAGATGEKFVQMYAGATGSDSDEKLAVSTAFIATGWFPFRTMQVVATVGTGAVTFAIDAYYLP